MAPLALRPGALDVGEHGPDLCIAQHVCETGHIALVSAAHDGGRPFLDDAEQDIVGMVPCVAARVVRWRWQATGGEWRLPVRLSFESRAVAAGAPINIDLPTLRQDFRRYDADGCGIAIMSHGKDHQSRACKQRPDPGRVADVFSQQLVSGQNPIGFTPK